MSPRTRIREDQTEDLSFISEFELNEFFQDVVVTGTETDTEVVKFFKQYFRDQQVITAGTGIIVTTGIDFVQIASTAGAALPLVGDNFVSVVTGTNQIQLYTDAIVSGNSQVAVVSGANTVSISSAIPHAIVAGTNITVASGANTIQISSTGGGGSTPNAIVSGSPDLTVTSGSNVTIISDNNRAIVTDATGFLSVTSGTSTITLTVDALLGVSGNTTVVSGSNAVTVSGVVTVTSGIAYINDPTRGNKTLSVGRPVLEFGYNGLADGNYLHTATSEHTAVGFPIWRPATITAISAYFPSGPNNKQFEVRKNGTGTSIRTLLVSPTVMSINDAENIDLNKGDYLQVFVTSALTGAQDPVVSIEIAWRLP